MSVESTNNTLSLKMNGKKEKDIRGGHRGPVVPSAANYNILRSSGRTAGLRAGNGTRFPAKLGLDYDRFHRRLKRSQRKLASISFLSPWRKQRLLLQAGYLVIGSITSGTLDSSQRARRIIPKGNVPFSFFFLLLPPSPRQFATFYRVCTRVT